MCSQPIVQAAHDVRATAGAGPRSSAGQPLGPLEVARLEVPGRQGVEAVEGEQVGDGPQLAVLLGRRAERAGREVAGQRDGRAGVGQGRPAVAPDGDGLDPLRAQDRAQAAPAGVPAVVAERRERDQPLARRADRRDLPVGAVLGADAVLGLARRGGPRGRPRAGTSTRGSSRPSAVDEDDRRLVAGARDRDRVDPRPLRGDREVRRAEGVAEPAGQRADRDDGELGRGRQRAADQRAEREDQRRVGAERVGAGGRLVGDDPGPQADPAEEVAERPRRRAGRSRSGPAGGRPGGSGRGSRAASVSLPRRRPAGAARRRRPAASPGRRRTGRR